jgi:hypothetical protein
MAGITCSDQSISPIDIARKILRKDGNGNFAIAVTDMGDPAGWSAAIECGDELTWEDIVKLIYNKTNGSINIIDET